jgi:hypothetical protein
MPTFCYAALLFGAGTRAPSRRAFESPIAIACFGFVTFLPLLPMRSLPRFISCISCPTSSEAFGLYRRPLDLFPELPRDDPLVRRDADFLLRDPLEAVFRAVRPVDFRPVDFLPVDFRPVDFLAVAFRPRDELADFFRAVEREPELFFRDVLDLFVAAMTFSLLRYSDAHAIHKVASPNPPARLTTLDRIVIE